MTLNYVMAVILRYFTEFGKHMRSNTSASICGGFLVRARCRRKESSRSLSHLLMSFLSDMTAHHSVLLHPIFDLFRSVFTALHVMQTRYSDENSVRPSVCVSVRLSVRLSHA